MGVRTVRVSADFILEMSKVGTRQACECIEGVPDDARVVGLQVDQFRNAFVMALESREWPEEPADEEVKVVFRQPEDNGLLNWLLRL